MKIVYVVPGLMEQEEAQRRENLLKKWAFPNTTVEIKCVTEGPASIESMYEEYLSIPATAKEIYRLEREGYDAAILGCAGDPGLDAMREITTRMLVVGPGANSYLMAAQLGHRFSVLTVTDSVIPACWEMAYKAGVSEKLASVRAINVAVLDLAKDRQTTLDKIVSLGKEAIEKDRADSLVLGCMSMGFLNVAEEVQEILKIPVVNPSKAVLKAAEAIVACGLTHSNQAYFTPPKIANGKVASLDELMVG